MVGLMLDCFSVSAQTDYNSRVLMNMPDYPAVFELDIGETYTVTRGNESTPKTIKLISIRPFFESNLWFAPSGDEKNYISADVLLEIEGEPVNILHRPYQMPITVHGLRLYVECIKEWNDEADYGGLNDVQKAVRLSVCGENETWGQSSFVFPIKDYRWRSSVYNNTWSALVP